MAAFKTVEYTAQVAGAANGAAMADGNKTAETVLFARVRYTLLATETTGDTIGLWNAPAGVTILPALSTVYSTDPGTTLTGTIGISTDTDAYSSALTLSAGGLIRWVPTTYPTELTEATLVNFTIASDASLTATTVLEFDIAYCVRH